MDFHPFDKNPSLVWKENPDGSVVERIPTIRTGSLKSSLIEEMLTPPPPFSWGVETINQSFPPINKGHFIILFGQSGSGKTQFALHMARENAKKLNNVLFISLEMSIEQIARGYALKRQGLTKEDYRKRNIQNTDAVVGRLDEIDTIKFVDLSFGKCSVDIVHQVLEQNNADIVFVDNLNKLQSTAESEIERDNAISDELLALTRERKIPIVIIHHANKPPAKSSKVTEDDRLPFRGINGLRGSNKIMDDADVVVELCRPTPEYVEAVSPDNPLQIAKIKNELDEGVAKKMMDMEPGIDKLCGLYVMKDRDWGDRAKVEAYFVKGQYQEYYI